MGQRTRPKAELRFFVEGKAVSGPEFWEAVSRLGGRAIVETVDPADLPAPKPTEKGRRLAGEAGR